MNVGRPTSPLRGFGLGLPLAKSIGGIRLQIGPNLRRAGILPGPADRDLIDRFGRAQANGDRQLALAQITALARDSTVQGLATGFNRYLGPDGTRVRSLAIAHKREPDRFVAELGV